HRDIVTFFQNSVREPKLMITDLKAKLYAAIRIQKRMEETVSEYGIDALIATLRKTLDDTDKETRRRLKEWPDGTVRAQSMADGTLKENILIKTQLKMTKKDDKLIFDFRGSAPAFANRPNNSVLAAIKGMISQMFLSFIWPDIPRNQAVLNPVEFIVD